MGRQQATETLDELIARRSNFLTAYQNAEYAAQYTSLVERVRAAEARAADGSDRLTSAVARALFKLMAYKDEYEVARLHTQTGFEEKLREEFEGDFSLTYHLAPPVFSWKKDARGRPLKRKFRLGMRNAFTVLARLKVLRGTPFDIFGYSRERRIERSLIGWYQSLIDGFCHDVRLDNIGALTAIAELPMEIRGYGPVKDQALKAVHTRLAKLLPEAKLSTTAHWPMDIAA